MSPAVATPLPSVLTTQCGHGGLSRRNNPPTGVVKTENVTETGANFSHQNIAMPICCMSLDNEIKHKGSHKTLRRRSHSCDSFSCKLHHVFLSFVSVHQMAPPITEVGPNCSLLLIYRPGRDERLSWPGWMTYSGRSTHISGHPLATG